MHTAFFGRGSSKPGRPVGVICVVTVVFLVTIGKTHPVTPSGPGILLTHCYWHGLETWQEVHERAALTLTKRTKRKMFLAVIWQLPRVCWSHLGNGRTLFDFPNPKPGPFLLAKHYQMLNRELASVFVQKPVYLGSFFACVFDFAC